MCQEPQTLTGEISTARLSRRCHPGARGVFGRSVSLHHQEREGPWYVLSLRCANPDLLLRRSRVQPDWRGGKVSGCRKIADMVGVPASVRDNDILVLLESEREARRLR